MDAVAWIAAILKIVFVLIIILTFAPVLIWAERRQSAMIQDRVGPHRAGVKLFGKNITLAGLLHPLADALKFVWKEDFIPPKADKLLHSLAPIIALVPAISVFAVIPFGGVLHLDHLLSVLEPGKLLDGRTINLQIADVNVGILYVFAIAGTGVVGAAIAGYSSDNKYALLGGVRAAGQMVSYEVTLGLALVGCFMVYDTLQLSDMINWQRSHNLLGAKGLHLWGIFVQPLAFFLFFTAAIAETKRIPFDVPEGESELAAGYFTEYSGMKFGMFFMGEFVEVITSSALIAVLFLGGYDVPFLEDYGFDFFGKAVVAVPHVAVIGIQVLAFIVKLVILIWLQLMIRWSLPRFRYDQIMRLCWKLLLPLSLLNIFLTGIIVLGINELGSSMGKLVNKPGRTFREQAYIPEIVKGLGVTMKHFFKNTFSKRENTDIVTIMYPEEKRIYPERFRGVHRLTHRSDGSPRCVACLCCSTACPAQCIHIEAAEYEPGDPGYGYERFPKVFVIDELRCIFCGYCVEACPCDAIRMDTGVHMPASTQREHFIFDKEMLMSLPGQDGTFLTANPRHEPGDPSHPGLDREHKH